MWVVVGLSVGLGVVCACTPLLNVLGYESAALVGALAPWLGGALWWGKGELEREGSPAARWWRCWWRGWLAVGLPPAVVLGVAGLWVPNCDWVGGVGFWGLIVGGSLGYGALVGALVRRRWQGWVVLGGLWVAAALELGWTLATQPPLVATQPFIGYFAGSIYDEGLGVPSGLMAYRLLGACFIGAVLVALELGTGQGRARGWWVVLGALVAAVIGLGTHRAELGIAIDREAVGEVLAGVEETPHFELRYAPGSWHAEHIQAIAADHEARYDELAAWFQEEPVAPGERVRVWIYPDSRVKGRLMGSRRTLVARLWLRELHILYPEIGYPILKHELAHVFSAPWGRGPLQLSGRLGGVLPHMGMVEGLAEATVGYRGELTLHVWSAAMRRLGFAPDLRGLIRVEGFWTTASGQAYTLMGSFVQLMVERYGVAPLRDAYADADFERAYGKPLDALVAEWEAYVDAIPLEPEVLAQARFTFDRPTLFERRCARAIGALRGEGADWLDARRPERALPCFEEAAALSPEDPSYALDVAAVLAQLDRRPEALQRLDDLLRRDDLSRIQRAEALTLAGDLRWPDDPAAAQRSFREAQTPELPAALRRGLDARLLAFDAGLPDAHRFFDPLTATHPGAALARLNLVLTHLQRSPDHPLSAYLAGRELWRAHLYADAAPWLRRAAAGDLPDTLRLETLRLLGQCAFLAGDLKVADEAFHALEDDPATPSGLRLDAEGWRRRLKR